MYRYKQLELKFEITSNFDALVQGLVLAVTAPTEGKSKDALALAESFAVQLTAEDVAKAKKTAEAIIVSGGAGRN